MIQDKNIFAGFMNLHDAFLNASLQYSCMSNSPVEDCTGDPLKFLLTDRGRFERAWIAFLFVLVEAYQSEQMEPVRKYISSITDTSSLDRLLTEKDKLEKMRQTRHYMCHRDRREYWDIGRLAPIGNLQFHEDLHYAFSDALLDVFRQNKSE